MFGIRLWEGIIRGPATHYPWPGGGHFFFKKYSIFNENVFSGVYYAWLVIFFHLMHFHFIKINDWEYFRGIRGWDGGGALFSTIHFERGVKNLRF